MRLKRNRSLIKQLYPKKWSATLVNRFLIKWTNSQLFALSTLMPYLLCQYILIPQFIEIKKSKYACLFNPNLPTLYWLHQSNVAQVVQLRSIFIYIPRRMSKQSVEIILMNYVLGISDTIGLKNLSTFIHILYIMKLLFYSRSNKPHITLWFDILELY